MHGFSKFFRKNSDEEREHAQMFMDYQNHRGGTILLKEIPKPKKDSWNSILEAVEDSLALEKDVNKVQTQQISQPICLTKQSFFLCVFYS